MGIRILIVDDEEDTLSLLRTILLISGFDPITTLNSVEAIGLAEREKPDVALIDIMMPRLDGFTLCKMMRQRSTMTKLPIIFVTAYESLDLEERRVEAGADLVIRKPIDFDVLIKSIDTILKTREVPPPLPQVIVPPGNGSTPAQPAPSVSETQEHDKTNVKSPDDKTSVKPSDGKQ
jgi:DNA-binding response OmpR family regulator